ncbi:MAG TPA: hypothetical protein VN397_03035, partial [Candidatus Methylomirabilis sp.]|nr:hypothetical protein [Candidatus Methylomirabilis sp.]
MSQQQTQRLVIAMPQLQWSLVQAYQIGFGKPPPYKEPTFEEEEFTPRLKLELRRIPGFENLDHVARLRVVDEANEVFRFAYTRGRGEDDGRTLGYFKIPLLRNRNVEPDEIKIRMSAAEYERATAILSAVGEMERIARAVPYYGLYRSVRKHLKRMGGIPLEQTVLVSVDRGGRIPCTILQRALGLPTMLSLKVNQGGNGDGLDQDKLAEFAESGALRGKYVLFVDSTVDSGRQINALKKFFDPWCSRIGFSMWSIVGSNEYGKNLDSKHSDINWGVDPDNTFEDKPELMGIDYAPGSYEKVVECPSDASRAIRACLLAVPDGYVYAANDIDAQIDRQRKEWAKRQKQRRIAHRKLVRKERSAHRKETQEWRAEKKRVTAADRLE